MTLCGTFRHAKHVQIFQGRLCAEQSLRLFTVLPKLRLSLLLQINLRVFSANTNLSQLIVEVIIIIVIFNA